MNDTEVIGRPVLLFPFLTQHSNIPEKPILGFMENFKTEFCPLCRTRKSSHPTIFLFSFVNNLRNPYLCPPINGFLDSLNGKLLALPPNSSFCKSKGNFHPTVFLYFPFTFLLFVILDTCEQGGIFLYISVENFLNFPKWNPLLAGPSNRMDTLPNHQTFY